MVLRCFKIEESSKMTHLVNGSAWWIPNEFGRSIQHILYFPLWCWEDHPNRWKYLETTPAKNLSYFPRNEEIAGETAQNQSNIGPNFFWPFQVLLGVTHVTHRWGVGSPSRSLEHPRLWCNSATDGGGGASKANQGSLGVDSLCWANSTSEFRI